MREFGVRPNRELGQNFLVDDNILEVIGRAAELDVSDVVLEVGGGLGVLSEYLAERVAHLHVVEVRQEEELASAFAALAQARADALLVVADTLLLNRQRAQVVADLAAQHRLPAMYNWREYVDAGLLMSYGPSQLDMQRRTAVYVAKILKGAKPADLPVEQPTKFELVINLKTAKTLGITMPPSLLLLADEVIQ